MATRSRCLMGLTAAMALAVSVTGQAQVNVTTWKNDLARDGANTQETILTTANVNVNTFGKLFEVTVDGDVYAQPLVLTNVSIAGGTHNVVYVETENDSVYAMDADTGTLYAQVSLIPAGGTAVSSMNDLGQNCGDIAPSIGITGTPVIDPTTNTMYLVAKVKVNGSVVQYLHALDTTTLADEADSPVEITAQVPGTASDAESGLVTFNPVTENQRPGLALDQGHVLIGWASHCDHGAYHGWLMSYSAASLQQEAAWNATPNGQPQGTLSMGAIWMSGAAPAIDGSGNIYVATGNGYQDGVTEFGNAVVKLGLPGNGTLPVLDWFGQSDQFGANTIGDQDLGSGGVTLLPQAGAGAQLLAQAGKAGFLHMLDQNDLGENCSQFSPPCSTDTQNPHDTQIPQEMMGPLQVSNNSSAAIFTTPLYWNQFLYWNGGGTNLAAYAIDPNSGLMSSAPVSQTNSTAVGTFSNTDGMSLSANGTSNGIVWFMHNNGTLYAFNATDLTQDLWDSGMNNGRDRPGSSTKFAPPTIANGKVYIGVSVNTQALAAYGLLNQTTTAAAPVAHTGKQ